MAVGFYFDVHVPQAIADQLRRRRVDILTAIEDASTIQYVLDLDFIAKVSEPHNWINHVQHIPF